MPSLEANQPRITAVVVSWNSRAVIRACIHALAAQRPIVPILVIDNHSVDATLEEIEASDVAAPVLRNPRNLGYARAANQGIAVTRTPYIAILNPDVRPEPSALARAVQALDARPGVGSVAPWLFRTAEDLSPTPPRGTVDSSGLALTRSRRAVDRDAGTTLDRPAGSVFGPSGAFAVYRRSALESIRVGREYFDEDFFAYKEDVDLAWRLQRAGWSSWFEPQARAIHTRGVAGADRSMPTTDGRSARPLSLVRLAYRNHLLMLLKNVEPAEALIDLPWILGEEAAKFLYYLVRRPLVLGTLGSIPRLLPSLRKKRAALRHSAMVPARTVARRWFRHR